MGLYRLHFIHTFPVVMRREKGRGKTVQTARSLLSARGGGAQGLSMLYTFFVFLGSNIIYLSYKLTFETRPSISETENQGSVYLLSYKSIKFCVKIFSLSGHFGGLEKKLLQRLNPPPLPWWPWIFLHEPAYNINHK